MSHEGKQPPTMPPLTQIEEGAAVELLKAMFNLLKKDYKRAIKSKNGKIVIEAKGKGTSASHLTLKEINRDIDHWFGDSADLFRYKCRKELEG